MFFIKKLLKMGREEPQSSKIEARQAQFRIQSDVRAGGEIHETGWCDWPWGESETMSFSGARSFCIDNGGEWGQVQHEGLY